MQRNETARNSTGLTGHKRNTHQSLNRAAHIVAAIGASEGKGLRASDIAQQMGLGLSTITRILAVLQEMSIVEQDEGHIYTLGTRILKLSSQELNKNAIFQVSRMPCQMLAQTTRLNANVGIPHDTQCLYLCHFEGDLSPKNQSMVGYTVPLHASGLGKCLLLDTTQEEREQLLGLQLPAYTTHTITSHDELTRQLEQGTRDGFCAERQEMALGRSCFASPIRGRHGGICASISISGRTSLLSDDMEKRAIEQLIETADRISVSLGHISGTSHQ